MIKHDNIFYARNINVIGGVETYVYELAKKYKDKDIAVVCKTIAPEQKKRLKEYCKVYVHKNEPIECKVIITNWDTSIINFVNKEAMVYTVLHTDYSHYSQGAVPVDDPRITYIGITEVSKKSFEKITGITDRVILCRNPLNIENEEKPLILMSATRLTKEKGGHRMLKLANELDQIGVKYIWFIFTSDEYNKDPVWQNKNVIKMNNRLDLDYFYNMADWYVQFSEVEGDSYSLKEALYRGVPIAVCELPYFKEIGIENGKNALYLNFDCSNINEVAEKIKSPLKFEFTPIKDGYDEIIADGKSHYEEEKNMKVKVKCTRTTGYFDIELDRRINFGEEFVVEKERADYLKENNAVEILEIINEVPKIKDVDKAIEDIKESAKEEVKKEKKTKKKKD